MEPLAPNSYEYDDEIVSALCAGHLAITRPLRQAEVMTS